MKQKYYKMCGYDSEKIADKMAMYLSVQITKAVYVKGGSQYAIKSMEHFNYVDEKMLEKLKRKFGDTFQYEEIPEELIKKKIEIVYVRK